MTTLRTAAQQALELRRLADKFSEGWHDGIKIDATDIMLLAEVAAALEQPEQEPVAWMVYTQDGKSVCVTDNPADFVAWRSFPLYTHPPRRTWQGLTEEEIYPLYSEPSSDAEMVDFARAIEQALKERNT